MGPSVQSLGRVRLGLEGAQSLEGAKTGPGDQSPQKGETGAVAQKLRSGAVSPG